MKNKITRRQALNQLITSPLAIYLGAKMSNFNLIADTLAASGVSAEFLEFKLINMLIAGGSNRWHWDLPIQPNGASDIIEFNPHVITKYHQESDKDGLYELTRVGDFYMPSIWSSKIATPSGHGSMVELAENMLAIRGIHIGNSGHAFCRYLNMTPAPGKSLLGVTSDASSLPIAAVTNSVPNFTSQLGRQQTKVSGSNQLAQALSPFVNGNVDALLKTSNVEAGIDAALNIMKQESAAKHKFIPSTYLDRVNAKKLMKKEFGNLTEVFTNLEAKYETMITRSFSDSSLSLAGVEDRAIPGGKASKYRIKKVNNDDFIYNGPDIRSIFTDNSSCSNMARSFAVGEFMITEGYTSVFDGSMSQITNCNFHNMVNGDGDSIPDINNTAIGTDSHFVGSHISLMAYTKLFRALSSCSNELVNKLKDKTSVGGVNLFDKTVLTLTSDFNRSARMAGDGSDHGNAGTNFTILSGMVPKLTVIGNCTQYGRANKYGGSWGVAAPIPELVNRKINMGNVASSVCTMLGLPSVTPNDQSLITKNNGKISSVLGKPRNV